MNNDNGVTKQASKARLAFAENLRRARRAKKLSQEAVAELAGLHRTYVGSVERGERNVSIDNMERLADALGITLPSLLDERRHDAGAPRQKDSR